MSVCYITLHKKLIEGEVDSYLRDLSRYRAEINEDYA